MKTSTSPTGAIALTTMLAPIAWGTTYWVVTELLPADRPLLVAATRVVPAGLLLVAIGLATSGWRPRGREWRHVALLSLANFGVFFPLLIAATYRVPGGVIASFAGLQPLLVLLGAWLMAGWRPRGRDVAVGVSAAVGVLLVVGLPGGSLDPLGLVLALAANVSFAAGVVLTKHLPVPPDRIAHTGWQLVLRGLLIVPLAVVVEGIPSGVSGSNLLGAAYLGIVATGAAGVLWFNGVQRLPVAAPPLLGLASAVTGVIVGWVVLGQGLSLVQSAGFLLTLAAIGYGALLSDRRTAPAIDRPPERHLRERDGSTSARRSAARLTA